jgi:hypothetical protein
VWPRPHVDDVAATLFGHDAGDRVRHNEVTGQVHVNNAAPPSFVGFEEVQHWTNQASVVDQYIDASVFGHDRVDHRPNSGAVGDIGNSRHRCSAGCVDGVDNLVCTVIADVVYYYLGANTSEPFADCSADTACAASDDDDLVFECFMHVRVP